MKEELPTDIVSVYPCTSCGDFIIVEQGNYHPWCLHCMWDIFDWSRGYTDVTREQAELILRQNNE